MRVATIKRLLVLSLLLLGLTLSASSQHIWYPIHVSGNWSCDTTTLIFGYDPTATRGIDSSLGEFELPPPPFCSDARWINSELRGGTLVDFRPFPGTVRMDTFSITTSFEQNDTIRLMWDHRPMSYQDSIILKIPAGSDSLGNLSPSRKIDMRVLDTAMIPRAMSLGIRKFTILVLPVWRNDGVEDDIGKYVTTYSLSHCYPNPFNPSTEIRYSLPRAVNVSLRVYDVLGQEVRRLVNTFEQAGEKTVRFNAEVLPSGVYFYRLQAGSFTDTKKVILLR